MPNVINQHAPGREVKYLVYSHGHNDHVGAASAFGDMEGLEIVAHAEVAKSISKSGRPGISPPTITFTDQHRLSLGRDENVRHRLSKDGKTGFQSRMSMRTVTAKPLSCTTSCTDHSPYAYNVYYVKSHIWLVWRV